MTVTTAAEPALCPECGDERGAVVEANARFYAYVCRTCSARWRAAVTS